MPYHSSWAGTTVALLTTLTPAFNSVQHSYLGGPRPVDEYKALADSGAKWMGMGDAGISFRPPANGTLPDGYVEGWIEKLEPAMGNLSALGLLPKAYVYGFDEVSSTTAACTNETVTPLRASFSLSAITRD